ncbi:hypothetical protein [Flavitalea sp.]|nr:hypothetical protein [Flavitalea sp.]
MKKIYLALIFLISSASLFSQPYMVFTAQKSGTWNDLSVWNITPRADGIPKSKVIIPASYLITVDNGVNAFGLGNADLNLFGTLTIINNTNIILGPGSTIEVFGTGSIVGNNATQLITLGGVVKYDGSKDFTKTGDWIASSLTGISPFGFVSTAVLPVKMISFNLTKNNNDILLKWITASEVSNDYFSIERSNDGSAWTAIGTIKGASNTNSNNTYTFTDKNTNAAIIYYRLKQVDNKGSFSYSEVRKLATSVENTAKVYLVNNSIRVELANASSDNTIVTVLQSGGNLLARKSFNDVKTLSVDLKAGCTGVVFVNVSDSKQLNQTVKLLF